MDSTVFKSLEQLEQGTPQDRIIRLKSVYKTGKTTVQPVSDGAGWYLGVPRLSEDDKKALKHWAEPESKYTIKDGTTFNLNDEIQAVTWKWVKHSPCIALSQEECQFTPGAEFFIYLENKEAEKNVSRRELKHKAMDYIFNDSPVNYPMRASLLGVEMGSEEPVVIKDYLTGEAEKDPKRVLDIYESHDISLRLLLLKARNKNIITVDSTGIYRYENTALGMAETSVISWLQDKGNKHLVEEIEKQVNPEYFEKKETTEEKAKPVVSKTAPVNKSKGTRKSG